MRLRPVGLVALFTVAVTAFTASAVDIVIFKDGFSIKGRRFKEEERTSDAKNGVTVQIPKARGFDIVESGPKWIIFSNRSKEVGELIDNARGEGQFKEYDRPVQLKSTSPMPLVGQFQWGQFDDNWKRTSRVNVAGGDFHLVEQKIYIVSPSRVIIPSPSHRWYPYYDVHEFEPAMIRKFLSTHPSLLEVVGTPDAGKRLDIATFMKDAGWLPQATQEIDNATKEVAGIWPKEQTERADKLRAEIAMAETEQNVKQFEKALNSGRYAAASTLAAKFNEKTADAKTAKLYATLKAQVEIVQPRFEKARKLLRIAVDDLSGAGDNVFAAALAGGAVTPHLQRNRPVNWQELAIAGEQVWAELHPDTTERVELFLSLADQAATRKAAGKDPGVTSDRLVALAVTGWLKGKNGAEQDIAAALRLWQWRTMLLAYQTEPVLNNRRAMYQKISRADALTPDEIAQLIAYLPPPSPEDLTRRSGTPLPVSPSSVPGIYRMNTGPLSETSKGVDYLIRLPSEYHHGRPCRLLLAMHHVGMAPEAMVSGLAADADRNGYIIAAPLWANEFNGFYDYKGDQHYKALATLRSVLRRFRVDNDRVFVFGFGEGANFAMDLGASHPDLFAGVVAMGANPLQFRMFMLYWPNFQKLPVYVTIGSLAGSSFENVRKLFEKWMPLGFPAMATVYRGRFMEWFGVELPTMFDWMHYKERKTGTAVLRLGQKMEPWITMREADNRFYWVGTTEIGAKNQLVNTKGAFSPAEITKADIQQGNLITAETRGTKNIVFWFDRDIIDWTKPIRVQINGAVPNGYKAKVLTPDIEFMLEQLHQHGDRKLLFLNKLEFPTNQ